MVDKSVDEKLDHCPLGNRFEQTQHGLVHIVLRFPDASRISIHDMAQQVAKEVHISIIKRLAIVLSLHGAASKHVSSQNYAIEAQVGAVVYLLNKFSNAFEVLGDDRPFHCRCLFIQC